MSRPTCIYNKKVCILFLVAVFFFSGCTSTGDFAIETDNVEKEDERSDILSTSQIKIQEEENEDIAISENVSEQLKVPVNVMAQDVYFHVEDGIELLGAMRRCVSDGENIYLVYGTQDLYIMPLGADEQSRANIDNPEGLDVCHIAMDSHGKIHLLMADSSGDMTLIWQLDEKFQVDKVIDISSYMETKQMPVWFLIDKDGTYYLQWTVNRDGIVLDREGELMYRFTPKSLGTGWIYQASLGKDGQIYLVHSEKGEKIEIDKLDVADGSVIRGNSSLYFSGDEVFSAMSCGTDTNLLLFSPYSGAWAYDQENGIMENRIQITDIDFGRDLEFWPLTFLTDGRLLLLGKDGEENYLKYVPLGR